jgi:hypothetical protein
VSGKLTATVSLPFGWCGFLGERDPRTVGTPNEVVYRLPLFSGPLGGVFAVGFSCVEFDVLQVLSFRFGDEESRATLHLGILAAVVGVRYRNPPVDTRFLQSHYGGRSLTAQWPTIR